MKTTHWKDVTGQISVELYTDGDVIRDYDGDAVVPVDLPRDLIGEHAELVIEFTSSGYHQPMSRYGGPDHLGWPEESSEEREPSRAYFYDGSQPAGHRETPLPHPLAVALFVEYHDRIEAAELDPRD